MPGRLATIGEVFFDEPVPTGVRVDLIRCVQRSSPLAGARCVPFETRVIDLRPGAEEIARGFEGVTRYEISRAERSDGFDADERWDGPDAGVLDAFCASFDRWTAPVARRRISRIRVRAHAERGVLHLSRISRAGEPLAWHAYHRAASRVRLLYSTSSAAAADPPRRALASRANRLLHWRDIRHFGGSGVAVYDLGGWYGGDADRKMKGIDRFKASFGGSVVRGFNCALPLTARGEIALRVEGLLERIRNSTRSPR